MRQHSLRPGWTALTTSLVAASLLGGCGQPNAYQEPPPAKVTAALPVRQTVTSYLEETGTTEPVEMVQIRARVTGFLEEIRFEPGTVVEAGEVLYVIQPREFRAQVNAARAQVASREVEFRRAETEYQRQLRLAQENATADIAVVQTQADRDAARATLDQAQAQLDQAELNLEYTEVRTPIGGRVGKTLVKIGNLVDGVAATHLTTVISYDPIWANFNISERSLLSLAQNVERRKNYEPDPSSIGVYLARATDEGFPFEGHFDYADLAVDQSTGTFMIRGIFPNPRREILPGLFVRVRIPFGKPTEALLIPERAVGADQAGRFLLLVNDEDIVERRNITMGAKYDEMIVVEEGLTGNERIVVNGMQRARPGVKVDPEIVSLEARGDAMVSVEQGNTPPPPATEPDETAQP